MRTFPIHRLLCLIGWMIMSAIVHGQDSLSHLTAPVTYASRTTNAAVLLDALQQRTGYVFSYNKTEMAAIPLRELDYRNAPLGRLLRDLHDQYGLSFLVTGKNIAVIDEGKSKRRQLRTDSTGKGTIHGRIVDFETTQPLPGASVMIEGTTTGVLSDEKGFYTLKNIPPGRYTLIISFVGYQNNHQSGIKVEDGKTADYDIRMAANTMLNTVVVNAGQHRIKAVTYTTEKQLLQEIRVSRGVVSGISNEQINKSADRNAAEIVKRISAVTVVDDKFIVVRGMNQRYNITYLNNNLAPSTEVYNRNFAYDMLPSSIIDRILVFKSPVAELAGDYAGGAVKVFTKNARPVRHLDIGFQTGFRSGTTFGDINTYKGGKTDWLGIDDGTRKLPSNIPDFRSGGKGALSQAEMVSSFTNTWLYQRQRTLPDMQFFVNFFDNRKLGKGRLYDLTSLTYTYENRRYLQQRQTGNTYAYGIDKYAGLSYGDKNAIGTDDQSMRIARLNLLENLTWKMNDGNRIELNNFLLNDGRNTVDVYTRHANEYPDYWKYSDQLREKKRNTFTFRQRFLYNGNLGGYHRLGRKQTQELHWNLGYSYSMQDVPDQRIANFQSSFNSRTISQSVPPAATDVEPKNLRWMTDFGGDESLYFGMLSRLFVRNRENVYNASADYSYLITPTLQLKAGAYQLFRTREVTRRFFKVLPGGLNGKELTLSFAPGAEDNHGAISANLVNFREQDLATLWDPANFLDNGTGLQLLDVSSPLDHYVASEQNNSGYLQGEWKAWKERIVLNAGLRFEHNEQRIAASQDIGFFYPLAINLNKDSWLPSVNLNFRPDSVWVVRASYGRTVNRPEFREIAPFSDYDFVNGENLTGNPRLQSSVIDNYDLRIELYPRSGENISLGAFYKYIDKPIERVRFSLAGDAQGGANLTQINYFNPDKAKVYGLELDLRKNLDFIPGKLFRNLSVVANGAWMKSEVSRVYKPDPNSNGYGPGERIGSFSGRPLQGQAPYIVNGSLFYDNPGWGTKLGLTYNISGTTIYAIGDGNAKEIQALQKADILDQPQTVKLNTGPGLLELPRNLLDLSFTQRIYKSLQLRINVQNLLDVSYRLAEDHNWDNKYQPEQRRDAVSPIYQSKGYYYYQGDNDYLRYKTGRYFTTTFTYVF